MTAKTATAKTATAGVPQRELAKTVLRLLSVALTVIGIGLYVAGDLRPPVIYSTLDPSAAANLNWVAINGSYDYTLGQDSHGYSQLDAIETINTIFLQGSKATGIDRYLPVDQGGHPAQLEVRGVTLDGDVVPFTVTKEGDLWHIATTSSKPLTDTHAYVISYSMTQVTAPVLGADRESYLDVLSWNVTGQKSIQPAEGVDVTVHLSPALAERLVGDPTFEIPSATIPPGGTLTRGTGVDGNPDFAAGVDVVFPSFAMLYVTFAFEPGTFVPSPRTTLEWVGIAAPFVLLGVGILLLVLALLARVTLWRNAPGRGIIVAESAPEPGVDVLLASRILGRASRGIPAALIDLAVRGNLRLLRVDAAAGTPGAAGGAGAADSAGVKGYYAVEPVSREGLSDDEAHLFEVLFDGGAQPRPVKVTGGLVKVTGRPVRVTGGLVSPGLRQLSVGAFFRSVREGFRRAPAGLLRDVLAWGAVAATALQLGATHQLAFHATASQGWVLFAVSIGSAVICAAALLVAVTSYPLTEKGALAREHLLGVREYISVAEQQRIRFLQGPVGSVADGSASRGKTETAELTDPLLPYAVLFNQERGWRRTLDLWAAGETPTGWWSPRA